MASKISQLPVFRAALITALAGRANLLAPPGGLPPVQISSGSLAPEDVAAESIMLLGAQADEDWAVIGPTGRRREETAATRSLLNTARLMENNPLLVRLKELETLEKIAEKVDKITVGSFDSLLSNLVTLGK